MIALKNVHFGYKHHPLFQDLSLNLSSGHIYGLLGKNGVGKTTLLKLISGFRFPKSGSISTMGMPAQRRDVKMLEELYFLPEKLYYPLLKIKDFVRIYAPFYAHFNYEQFEHSLALFEITSQDEKINHLSFGQQKN